MDLLELAALLPKLTARVARDVIVDALGAPGRFHERALVAASVARFEALLARDIADGVRPGLLFEQRDLLALRLRTFARTPLARRLGRLRRASVLRRGAAAKPFDALLRTRAGRVLALLVRPMPTGEARLDIYRAARGAIERFEGREPLVALMLIDPLSGASQILRLDEVTGLQRGSTAA
ncbi:MAG TPA: hypothetical protein VMV73_02565 [Candidatus Dormibacteraeota bacterium]|nr:hypothetical protein [Candidatus Dormibacteraeota bacterium]